MTVENSIRICATLLAFVLLTAMSCEEKDVVVHYTKDTFTLDDEIKIGTTLSEEIHRQSDEFPILNSQDYAEAYNYLDAIFQSLLNTPHITHRTNFDWKLSVIDKDDYQTAFSLPGGEVYIYTGMLKFLQTEHQLVSLLAHELFYIDHSEVLDLLKSEYGGVILGDIILDNEVELLPTMARELRSTAFAESQVMQADSFAVELLCNFSWNAGGTERILHQADSLQVDLEWFASRPFDSAERRMQRILDQIEARSCGEAGTINFENYQLFKSQWLP